MDAAHVAPLAAQRFRFCKPQTEVFLGGVFKIYPPVQTSKVGWICEFEAPGIFEGRRKGHGLGPIDALAAACAHITYLLDRVVDVSSTNGRQPTRVRKARPKLRAKKPAIKHRGD